MKVENDVTHRDLTIFGWTFAGLAGLFIFGLVAARMYECFIVPFLDGVNMGPNMRPRSDTSSKIFVICLIAALPIGAYICSILRGSDRQLFGMVFGGTDIYLLWHMFRPRKTDDAD